MPSKPKSYQKNQHYYYESFLYVPDESEDEKSFHNNSVDFNFDRNLALRACDLTLCAADISSARSMPVMFSFATDR